MLSRGSRVYEGECGVLLVGYHSLVFEYVVIFFLRVSTIIGACFYYCRYGAQIYAVIHGRW